MRLDDFVNGIIATDRKLQSGANNLAHKVNEWVGVGNYQLSTTFFGAAAALKIYQFGYDIHQAVTISDNFVNPFSLVYAAVSVYHVVKNRSLERREKEQEKESGEAISVDFSLQYSKKCFIDWSIYSYVPAKAVYAFWLFLDVPWLFSDAPYDVSMLLGQYFREVDHIRPTKKNKVFDFLGNLVPKRIAVPSPLPS